LYNGVYYKAEDWGGYDHYAKADRTAHLYHWGSNWWHLDDRENSMTNMWYRGGDVSKS